VWRQHEDIDRSGTEHDGKNAGTEPTDQRCDHDRGKERDVLNPHHIRIDGDPQRRGNPGAQESESIAQLRRTRRPAVSCN
jgi:hypothetical protein